MSAVSAVLGSLPSPSSNVLRLGPLRLHAYGLLIAIGVVVGVRWAERRWIRVGGVSGDIGALAVWAVPAGVIGARLYHVVTDYELYRRHLLRIFAVWDGGLGIPGGIAAGVITGVLVARSRRLPVGPLLDAVTPTLPLAQAIGRWGNWFNQELFGRPSTWPWAVRIDAVHRPAAFAEFTTFHPTFLYESMWNFAVVGLVLMVERHRLVRVGRLFAVYICGYAVGRLLMERLRIDFAHTFAGLRVNTWMSIISLLVAGGFVVAGRAKTDEVERSGVPELGTPEPPMDDPT